jgi:dihydrofolate synthase/folylpolyglutamate synthase
VTLDNFLRPYQRFGVHLGLDRIRQLLANLDNPQQTFPIIHVGGTNGKGSVCAYLSSVLTAAGYRVGRYTSPHLINWTERICINGIPITETAFIAVLRRVEAAIAPDSEPPTLFEVVTAAAWLYFAEQEVDIGIIEVGLGGRLDATNVCDRPLLSIITSISREHWQNLGSTLAAIATEKAGILKPNGDVMIGQVPPEAEAVFRARSQELNCRTFWIKPALAISQHRACFQAPTPDFTAIDYPLPLLGEIQLMNSALAIAAIQHLQQKDWQIPSEAIERGMVQTQWLGRMQWLTWKNRHLLVDGAHNPAAAIALRQYVNTLNQPISWVMGMLSTKDHRDIFEALLQRGDRLYLVPIPDHSTANPAELAILAQSICPDLMSIAEAGDVFNALERAIADDAMGDRQIILCGSLYLVGYFLQSLKV